MMWPPQSVQITSTPSFLSALATKWPPEITGPVASVLVSLLVGVAMVSSLSFLGKDLALHRKQKTVSATVSLRGQQTFNEAVIEIKRPNRQTQVRNALLYRISGQALAFRASAGFA